MNLSLPFYALLAGLLFALSAQDADAHPIVKRGGSVTLPLKRIQQRSDLHPQILHQQNLNRALRRLARMTGRQGPSDDELRRNLERRVASLENDPVYKRYNRFIPPGNSKRFNREGVKDSRVNAVVTRNKHNKSNNNAVKGTTTSATAVTAAVSSAAAASTSSASISGDVTVANTPTTANSLGLDIEGDDIGYLATIQMGTPPQDYLLLMDSGSADTWVGAENCQSTSGGSCGNHTFLGSTSSSSFKDSNKQFEVTYGTGAVQGTIIQDNMVVAGLSLDAHTFGVATTETVDFSSDSVPFDGLMGLAQSTLSEQGVSTPVESLASAGLIDAAITSFKISRLADDLNDGEVTFGALDTSKFDSSTLVTIDNQSQEGFWEGAVDSISVDGTDTGLSGRSAILDTGTTVIVAPTSDADAVHKLISGAQSDGQGSFTVPCTTNASVALTFGGQEFTIDPKDLAFTPVDANDPTGDCVSGISAGSVGANNEWLVGDVFLRNAYFSTNVNNNSVSLAKLV
ncbi:aspartic peptidase A1 [Guyanagaster necrorhizus]|uniref:Aspartic peptidase A1 n=1 Tax=Guyanagaster necrorhizus TaxID=856835 RepID=A0A9P7W315_9AGAR|nr:aspartic peptidase A1 [Guyanagaster necrorhizus MCA 3950]KAG7451050.1 aspartic peptidase A1 [Guyanagaster necrorhizus MCA 3950]